MKIRPRQQLLDIWRATVGASFRDGTWLPGGRGGSNSISDAEQLLCIMYPATALPSFQLDKPDETADDILKELQALGGSLDIPRLLTRALVEYMERYTDDSGSPIFSGEGYFDLSEPGTATVIDPKELQVVDSFSMAITLTLATLTFIQSFRSEIRREELLREMDRLKELSSIRLTAAMIGLLRSFSVHVFDVQSVPGRILCGRSNQNSLPNRKVITELRHALRQIRSILQTLTFGLGQAVSDLDNTGRLFECGWSWGIIKGAAPIDLPEVETREKFAQPDGVAADKPTLYFTGIALDCIDDLDSDRTRNLGLLDEGQRRLADALRSRRNVTQMYWSAIATLGTGRWPLEDLPWRTSDEYESDYYSLQICSMVVQEMVRNRAPDTEIVRVGGILKDLANRGRINRRPVGDDYAVKELHDPGVRQTLRGSEEPGSDPIGWIATNFAPLLLKRTFVVAGLLRDTNQRSELLTLADSMWDHLLKRRLGPDRDLWDQPSGAFAQLGTQDDELPSWYQTERVVECLVEAAKLVEQKPSYSRRLIDLATDLVAEAQHRLDREMLIGSAEAGPSIRGVLRKAQGNLQRANDILEQYPGSAAVLANEVLREFEALAVAREDAARGM